jgi:group II intron reverse transcriptase/maturase
MSIQAWSEVDWTLVEKRLSRLKYRIYVSSLNGETEKMHFLQQRLLSSMDAKLSAVRQVCQVNSGRKSAGVDGKSNLSPEERLTLASELKVSGKASPIRRVWIPKPGKSEKRPLGIPTLHDRALQQLALYALEPEWEAKFEQNSYGFRPGRCTQDAIQAIFIQLRGKSMYVFDADIRKCFDEIDHTKLLEKLGTFPLMHDQVRAWLRAGVMENFSQLPKDVTANVTGTPQGGVISPLLANVALHGLETAVKDYYVKKLYTGPKSIALRDRTKQIGLIRYADDFVVTHSSEIVILQTKVFIDKWLQDQVGLRISEEKSSVKSSFLGFKFLGYHIISVRKGDGVKCKIHVHSDAKKAFLAKTRSIILSNRSASAGSLILLLNPLIVGWCNYYRYAECVYDFKQVEYALFQQLRGWVFRRKSTGLRSKTSIKAKYFPDNTSVVFRGTTHKGDWILTGTVPGRGKRDSGPKSVFLVWPSWIKSEMWVKIAGKATPYNRDSLYWAKRNVKYSGLPARVCKLIVRQKFICPLCGTEFRSDSRIEVDHIKPVALGGNDTYGNLQALHDYCHKGKTVSDRQLISKELAAGFKPKRKKRNKQKVVKNES